MGVPVLILGKSGSGKTYSIKNLDPNRVGIFSVEKSCLPFKKEFKVAKNATYDMILEILRRPTLDTYIIDDSQYLLVNEFFDRAKETGYRKFTDIALNFRDLIHRINRSVPDNVIVYFLHHTEVDADGNIKAKTIGKMLDEKLTVEGCFNVVLMADVEGQKHFFWTQTDGTSTVKSPEGMFEETKIPNDLSIVDTSIRNYWNL